MSTLVDAIWEGPFTAEVGWPPHAVAPGGEAQVTEADLASSHWRRKPKPRAEKPARTRDEADS